MTRTHGRSLIVTMSGSFIPYSMAVYPGVFMVSPDSSEIPVVLLCVPSHLTRSGSVLARARPSCLFFATRDSVKTAPVCALAALDLPPQRYSSEKERFGRFRPSDPLPSREALCLLDASDR